jgi:hypothetical protein
MTLKDLLRNERDMREWSAPQPVQLSRFPVGGNRG